MHLIPVGIVLSKGKDLLYYNSSAAFLASNLFSKGVTILQNGELAEKKEKVLQFLHEAKKSEANVSLNSLVFSMEETKIKEEKYVYKNEEKQIPLSVSISTFHEENEEISHKVCVIHDQSIYEELETSRMKAQSQKTLFAKVNHELRNPLHGILGIFEIIMNDNINDKIKQQCRIGVSTGNLMLLLVNDILDICQLESSNFKLTEKLFSVEQALNNCVEIMRYRFEQKGLGLMWKVKGRQITIKNDINRYQQIVINLLSNALKFTNKGFVKVTSWYDNSTQKLFTKVKDTGEGIKQEEQSKMFSLYCKLEQQRSENPTGNLID